MSEHVPSGIAVMEAQAHTAMAQLEVARATEAAIQDAIQLSQERAASRQQAIAERVKNPEIIELNNEAKIAVYGTPKPANGHNHGYVSKTGYVHPVHGGPLEYKPNTEPVKERPNVDGRLKDILGNHRYGKTAEERAEYADRYKDYFEGFIKKGYEPSQAKLLMDLHEKDYESVAKLTGQFIYMGEKPEEANQKAYDVYDKMSDKREKLVLEGGAFTMAEYQKLLKGEDIYAKPNRDKDYENKGVEDSQEAEDRAQAIDFLIKNPKINNSISEFLAKKDFSEENTKKFQKELGLSIYDVSVKEGWSDEQESQVIAGIFSLIKNAPKVEQLPETDKAEPEAIAIAETAEKPVRKGWLQRTKERIAGQHARLINGASESGEAPNKDISNVSKEGRRRRGIMAGLGAAALVAAGAAGLYFLNKHGVESHHMVTLHGSGAKQEAVPHLSKKGWQFVGWVVRTKKEHPNITGAQMEEMIARVADKGKQLPHTL